MKKHKELKTTLIRLDRECIKKLRADSLLQEIPASDILKEIVNTYYDQRRIKTKKD